MWCRYQVGIYITLFLIISNPVCGQAWHETDAQENVGTMNVGVVQQHEVKRTLLQATASNAVEEEMAAMMTDDSNDVELLERPIFWYTEPCSNIIPLCDKCSEDTKVCLACKDGYVLRNNTCGCIDPRCATCSESADVCEWCSDPHSVLNRETGLCECDDGYMLSDANACERILEETDVLPLSSPLPSSSPSPVPSPLPSPSPSPSPVPSPSPLPSPSPSPSPVPSPSPSPPAAAASVNDKECIDPKCALCSTVPDRCDQCDDGYMLSDTNACERILEETDVLPLSSPLPSSSPSPVPSPSPLPSPSPSPSPVPSPSPLPSPLPPPAAASVNDKECIDPKCALCSTVPDRCDQCDDDFMLSENGACIPISRKPSLPPEDMSCTDSKCMSCPTSPDICDKCKDENAIVNAVSGLCECKDGYRSFLRGCVRTLFSILNPDEPVEGNTSPPSTERRNTIQESLNPAEPTIGALGEPRRAVESDVSPLVSPLTSSAKGKACIDPKCASCSTVPDRCDQCDDGFMLSKNNACIPISRKSSDDVSCTDSKCMSCPTSPDICDKCKDENAIVNAVSGLCECKDGYRGYLGDCVRIFSFINIDEPIDLGDPVEGEISPPPTNTTNDGEVGVSPADPVLGKEPNPESNLTDIETINEGIDSRPGDPTTDIETINEGIASRPGDPTTDIETINEGIASRPGDPTTGPSTGPQLATRPGATTQGTLRQDHKYKNATHPGFDYVNIRLETSTPEDVYMRNMDSGDLLLQAQSLGASGAATNQPSQQQGSGWFGKKKWKPLFVDQGSDDSSSTTTDTSSSISSLSSKGDTVDGFDGESQEDKPTDRYHTDLREKKELLLQLLRETDARIEELETNDTS